VAVSVDPRSASPAANATFSQLVNTNPAINRIMRSNNLHLNLLVTFLLAATPLTTNQCRKKMRYYSEIWPKK
jgi:hypothetical protein